MRKTLSVIIILLLHSLLYSQEVELKAFGTVGALYNDSDYVFRKDILQKDGSTKDISFKTDSVLGLQASVYLNDHLSIVTQGVVKNDYDDEISAEIDWAYINYEGANNVSIKIGRVRTPYYRNSQNLNIGYSNLMIRESIEVYGQVPFSSFNGATLKYTDTVGKYFYAIEAGLGKEDLTVPMHSLGQSVDVNIDDLYTLNLTFGTNIVEFRATYLQADITAANDSLRYLFSSLRGSGLNELSNKYEFEGKKSEYMGFGIFIDYDDFIFNAEYGQRRTHSFFADVHGYYATVGYSFDKTIPFVSYSKSKMDIPTYDANTPSSDLNILLIAQNLAQYSSTLGVKHYIDKHTDVKFQYEHIVPQGKYGSYYLGVPADAQSFNVVSFALDFIY